MAMSLEDLLEKEGFRGRRLKSTHRSSFGSEPSVHAFRDQQKSRPSTSSSSGVKKTERTKSDIPPRHSFGTNSRRREKKIEINEVGIQADNAYKDVYSNELYSPKSITSKHVKSSNSGKHRLGRSSSTDDYHKNDKSFDEPKVRRKAEVQLQPTVDQPALDEVAVKAIISIFSGYIQKFVKDEDFRTSLRHNCFSSLNYLEALNTETKVIENLEEAMEVVERAAEDQSSAKELKKALLQLSLITGLSSNELKDGFTSGIPNSKLSACAHLYLSIIYKLQKKDRISSKHVLQVFIESPFAARTILLPDLWENVIFPHLSHLKIWYNRESDFINDLQNKERKLNLLQKVYNEIIDSGTYQFAVYYKDWITEGVDAPSIPSIQIPTLSIQGVQHGGGSINSNSSSPRGPFSPQPMVSRKLYDAVFSRLRKPVTDEGENFEGSVLSSDDGSTVQDKRTLNELHQTEFSGLDISSHPEDQDGQTDENAWILNRANLVDDRNGNSYLREGGSRSIHTLYELPNARENELTLERLAKYVFAMQQHDSTLVPHCEEDESHPIPSPTTIKCVDEETDSAYESFKREQFSSSVPQDFICPLTSNVFEDPVTLETGQNFERSAIIEWFKNGNTTCPVTGKKLERQTVPFTNFILKRVIDKWKSQHSSHLLALASQLVDASIKFKEEAAVFILEQLLLGVFSKEEVLMNAKCLVSIGGVGFLIRRFECGNLEEKTNIVAMLLCCIEAESDCRNQVAANIEKSGLLQLLHGEQVISRENSVLLLTELICLNRRRDVKCFLSGFENEGILKMMQCLLLFLRSCTHELIPFVAVLLLHFDLMIDKEEGENESILIYREEAVDAITVALEISLSDENVRENCCRALLILGSRFSLSGKLMTEDWILEKAGFLHHEEEEDHKLLVAADDNIPSDVNEEEEREEWLRKLSITLLGDDKKKSFLEGISNCLLSSSSSSDMVRICLITVAWLSSALSSLPEADHEFHLSAFSALISPLKECLENGERIEHRILASVSLHNFSKIPECRMLLMTIGEEIAVPLGRLVEVTWTAKELYSILSHQYHF